MDHDKFQDTVIEKLTRLETHMESLIGNGQPGRISKLEDDVKSLDRLKWRAGGVITGASVVISALIHFFGKH